MEKVRCVVKIIIFYFSEKFSKKCILVRTFFGAFGNFRLARKNKAFYFFDWVCTFWSKKCFSEKGCFRGGKAGRALNAWGKLVFEAFWLGFCKFFSKIFVKGCITAFFGFLDKNGQKWLCRVAGAEGWTFWELDGNPRYACKKSTPSAPNPQKLQPSLINCSMFIHY